MSASGPDEKTLAVSDLWARTHPGLDLGKADPGATFKPIVDTGAATVQAGSAPGATQRGAPAFGEATRTEPVAAAGSAGYELIEEIGRGGMGVVYRARQGSLRREVAVKKSLSRGGARRREPFLAEALTTGLLDHPNIVPVHDLGAMPDGEVFIAMKLLSGLAWSALLHPATDDQRRRAAELDQVRHLEILLDVGNAVAFAHSKGIVHNDLKPANVMIGDFGEVVVMDWGVATALTAGTASETGAFHKSEVRAPCGTPAYMPPELAEGRGAAIGPGTDVYLLGAVLHEILTGRPPHVGESFYEVLLSAALSRPPVFKPDVPEELAAICRRALAADPAERWPSVAAFQDAVRGHLRHRESLKIADGARAALERCRNPGGFKGPPTPQMEAARNLRYATLSEEALAGFKQALALWSGNEAARAGEREARLLFANTALAYGDLGLALALTASIEPAGADTQNLRATIEDAVRVKEAARRANRRLRRAFAYAVLLIVAGLALGFFLVRAERDRAERNAAEAKSQAERAERERAAAERGLAETLLAQGESLAGAGRRGDAEAAFRRAADLLARLRLPALPADAGLFALERRWPGPVETFPAGPRFEAIAQGAATRDGRLGLEVRDGVAFVLDLEAGRALGPLRAGADGGGRATAAAIDPDGAFALAGFEDGAIRRFDLPGWTESGPPLLGHEGPVRAIALSPSGEIALSGGADRTIRRWHVPSGHMGFKMEGHEGAVTALAWARNTRFFLSGAEDRSVRIWDLQTARAVRAVANLPAAPSGLAVLADGAHAAAGLRDGSVRLIHIDTGREVAALAADAPVRAITTSLDGERLCANGEDGRVRAFDLARALAPGEKSRAVRAVAAKAAGPAAVSADGLVALVAGENGTIAVVDTASGRELTSIAAFRAQVVSLAFVPEGDVYLAVAASADGEVRLLDPLGARPVAASAVHPGGGPGTIVVPLPGRRALTGGADGTVRLHDLPGEREVAVLARHEGGVVGLAATRDGRTALSAGRDGAVLRLSVETRGSEPVASVRAAGPLAISPDGARAIVSGPRGALLALDLRVPAAAPRELRGHTDAVVAAQFSADGRFARSASADGSWRLWDVEAAAALHAFPGAVPLVSIAASADDRVVATAAANGTATIWDLRLPGAPAAVVPAPLEALRREAAAEAEASAGRVLVRGGPIVRAVPFAPDGRTLVVGAADGSLRFFSVGTGALARLRFARDDAYAVDISPDGKLVAAAGKSGFVEVRDAATGAALPAIADHPEQVNAIAFTPGSRTLVTGAYDGALRVIDLGARTVTARIPLFERSVASLALSADGRRALAASSDGELRIVEVPGGAEVRALPKQGGGIEAVALTSDGRLALVTGDDGSIRVFETATGREVRVLKGHGLTVYALAVSPDGRRAASGSSDGSIVLWDVAAGAEIRRLTGGGGAVLAVAFSPDGKLLASGTNAGAVVVHRVD